MKFKPVKTIETTEVDHLLHVTTLTRKETLVEETLGLKAYTTNGVITDGDPLYHFTPELVEFLATVPANTQGFRKIKQFQVKVGTVDELEALELGSVAYCYDYVWKTGDGTQLTHCFLYDYIASPLSQDNGVMSLSKLKRALEQHPYVNSVEKGEIPSYNRRGEGNEEEYYLEVVAQVKGHEEASYKRARHSLRDILTHINLLFKDKYYGC